MMYWVATIWWVGANYCSVLRFGVSTASFKHDSHAAVIASRTLKCAHSNKVNMNSTLLNLNSPKPETHANPREQRFLEKVEIILMCCIA